MTDRFGREINYMRLSVTDRCNLRCRYCMPEGVALTSHDDILTYEELLRVAGIATELGITRFKITGGEPLVRRGLIDYVKRLKALPGVEQVTLTTNGLLLGERLDELKAAGLDAVNLSLDALDGERYRRITGWQGAVPDWEALLCRCIAAGLRTKVNVVLLEENRAELTPLATLAERMNVDVRFIELMPIGWGKSERGISSDEALKILNARWPDLTPVDEVRGNGPARYYGSEYLQGRIGVIDAVSHRFCQDCNRVRLTSTGFLKSCLCYETGADLRRLLRSGATDEQLRSVMREAIYRKPRAHCFSRPSDVTEQKTMSQIGG